MTLPYSLAAFTSWIEQGPTTTSNRSSLPLMTFSAATRPFKIVSAAFNVKGISSMRIWGGINGLIHLIRLSSSSLRATLAKSWMMLVYLHVDIYQNSFKVPSVYTVRDKLNAMWEKSGERGWKRSVVEKDGGAIEQLSMIWCMTHSMLLSIWLLDGRVTCQHL